MKLGARILKTGIAITLSLLLGEFLSLPSPIFAAIAAVLQFNRLFTDLI